MKTQLKLEEINPNTCIVRGTHNTKGRNLFIEPGKTATRNLFYGRIIISADDDPVEFTEEARETGLICLRGNGQVFVNGESFVMRQYDALYVPKNSRCSVSTREQLFDIAEISAPVQGDYPLQFVSFDSVQKDPSLHFKAGSPPCERDLNILLGKNIKAGRIMAGVTFSSEGNWTSWPPHEHADMLEEAYLYIDMPYPQWGIQLVYQNPEKPELIEAVREGDVVIMPKGFHPNVAAPGGSINFLWMMAANEEEADRKFGVVNVQPEYAAKGSGLEASQK